MNHEDLSVVFESLPRAEASPGFTARTVARATEVPPPRAALRVAAAWALSAVVLFSGLFGVQHHREQVRLEKLRAEQRQIRKELDELRTMSEETRRSRVFVGSAGPYDFVIDLQKPHSTSARPAALHMPDDGVF